MHTTFLFLHVASAAIWVGAALAATLLSVSAGRLNPEGRPVAYRQLSVLGRTLFGPAALLTLAGGIGATLSGGYDMSAVWITWGFLGIVVTVVVGGGIAGSVGRRLEKAVASEGADWATVSTLARRSQLLGIFNLVVLLSTVWAMVAKPTL